jgi:hypothetical protein
MPRRPTRRKLPPRRRSRSRPASMGPEHVLAMERTAGNRAVAALLARKPLSNDAMKRDKAPGQS